MKIHQKILLALFLCTIQPRQYAASSTTNCASSNKCNCYDICTTNCTNLCNENNIYGKTFFAARSQGDNSARKMMGVENKIHLFGKRDIYGVVSVAIEYDQTFDNIKDIGKYFSVNGQASMTYGLIIDAADNGAFDINAFQFLVTGSGTLSFCPSKSDIIADVNLYIGLDALLCGAWVRLDVPIVHTAWDIGLQEHNVFPGITGAPFANSATPMTEALRYNKAIDGVIPPLHYGKVTGKQSATNIAGIRLDAGYDWIRRENWHLATSYDFVLPFGTKSDVEFLFEPMVGDSQRAQIGSTLNVAYDLWNNCDATSTLAVYSDATVTAYLPKYVQRLVGLQIPRVNRLQWVWSQYLILTKFANNVSVGLERAANILTGDIKIGADLLVDIAVMLEYSHRCFFAEIGYELWYRSKEEASKTCINIPNNTYANSSFDSARNTIGPDTTINTAATPIDISVGGYLTNDSIDYSPALHPSAFSNKIFGCIGYNWTECGWNPFVLIGGEMEFGQHNVAFSQWGIIGKGGISF